VIKNPCCFRTGGSFKHMRFIWRLIFTVLLCPALALADDYRGFKWRDSIETVKAQEKAELKEETHKKETGSPI
jgi:hypothetical protein